jgi:hypothetical protein
MLVYKQSKGLDISIWHRHNKAVFYMLIRCLGVYNNFKLINKPEPEAVVAQKQKVLEILKRINELLPGHSSESEERKGDFFEAHVKDYFSE